MSRTSRRQNGTSQVLRILKPNVSASIAVTKGGSDSLKAVYWNNVLLILLRFSSVIDYVRRGIDKVESNVNTVPLLRVTVKNRFLYRGDIDSLTFVGGALYQVKNKSLTESFRRTPQNLNKAQPFGTMLAEQHGERIPKGAPEPAEDVIADV